ncbi:MAG TPA: chemotaxis protein CheW [Myxococcales bacterium]|jgi:purine-binding chemotaxis protein CheW|nr:chemotaxis protein CheW [Myxococcales bacterium]
MPRAVICLHGGNRYAIPLSAVRRVTEMTFISRVPRAPPALLGVMNQQGRVACLVDLGPLVGLKARPARPEGKVVMLQRQRGDVGLYVSEVAGIDDLPAEARDLPEPAGAALAQVESAEGPVKLIDPEQLQRAIDNLVEA